MQHVAVCCYLTGVARGLDSVLQHSFARACKRIAHNSCRNQVIWIHDHEISSIVHNTSARSIKIPNDVDMRARKTLGIEPGLSQYDQLRTLVPFVLNRDDLFNQPFVCSCSTDLFTTRPAVCQNLIGLVDSLDDKSVKRARPIVLRLVSFIEHLGTNSRGALWPLRRQIRRLTQNLLHQTLAAVLSLWQDAVKAPTTRIVQKLLQ